MSGEKSPPARAQVWYSGRVQGVGFRVTARQIACGYDVAGIVRNLVDGRVELIVEGARPEIEAFLQGIDESGLAGFIAKKQVKWEAPRGDLRGFSIDH
jgi:acylphosphatase